MDNYKLITISIFFCFLFVKICLENFLGSGRMYENKIFFLFFFLKEEINLKFLRSFNFLNFFEKTFGTGYFNTGSAFYGVNIQPNIKQNW